MPEAVEVLLMCGADTKSRNNTVRLSPHPEAERQQGKGEGGSSLCVLSVKYNSQVLTPANLCVSFSLRLSSGPNCARVC